MATPFSDIYDVFLGKITDFTFLSLTIQEIEDNFLKGYLTSAIVDFKKCEKDLTDRDDGLSTFNIDLDGEEKEILAVLMIPKYLSPKIVTSELLKQHLSDKDFRIYSQANHLKELMDLFDKMTERANELIISYTYNDLGDFK